MTNQSWLERLFRSPNRSIHSALAAQQKRDYLHKMDLFRDLDHQAMEAIDQRTRMTTVSRGQIIYGQDDQPRVLFLIKRGRVHLYRLSPQGKKLLLVTLEPGTFFGEMPLIGETVRYSFAEAAEETLVCVMSRKDLEQIVIDYPQVGLRMIEVISRRLAESEAQREELAFRSVHSRISASLLRLSEQRGNDDVVHITHGDLSDMVGAYRETVTAALRDLTNEGLVALGRGRIVISDRPGLRSRAQE